MVVTTGHAGDLSAGARVASLLAIGLERLLASKAAAAEPGIVDLSPDLSVPTADDSTAIEGYLPKVPPDFARYGPQRYEPADTVDANTMATWNADAEPMPSRAEAHAFEWQDVSS